MDNRQKWHDWFAWYPIQMGEKIYWLRIVKRRLNEQSFNNVANMYVWDYLPKEEYEKLAVQALISGKPVGYQSWDESELLVAAKVLVPSLIISAAIILLFGIIIC